MIIITRPKKLGEDTANKLRGLGYDKVFILPLLTVQDNSENITYKINIKDYDAVIITSQNAANFIIRHIKDTHKIIYTIGSKTESILKYHGFKNILSLGENALSLIQFFTKQKLQSIKKVLYCRGNNISHNLKEILNATGYTVDEIISYQTTPIAMIKADILNQLEQEARYILFYSYQTAKNFTKIAKKCKIKLNNITAICISEKTASTILRLNWKKIKIAKIQNEDSMISLIDINNQ